MENNRKINIILSLIIAFCGWLYVMYNVDPTTTRTFRNVSITYSNEKDLEAKGIALKSADKKSVEIEVEGHRSELNKMDDSDIKVRADLSTSSLRLRSATTSSCGPSTLSSTSSNMWRRPCPSGCDFSATCMPANCCSS